jgi:hypothetical protein
MCSYLLLALTFAGLTFLAAGCSAEDKASTIPQEAAAQAIRSRLQSAGFEAEWASFRWRADFFGASVRQATLSVDGPNGSHVQFYRFDEAGQAAEAAAGVSPDGNSVPADGGTAMVSWIGPPHFFRQGRLVVLFAEGDGVHTSDSRDRSVLATLGEVMGPQFAGASLPNE